MLNDVQRAALERWYSQPHIIDEARELMASKSYDRLEELLHRRCLLPLSRHGELPGYMRDESGAPLFPTGLDPRQDEEMWQDAIEVGWAVVERSLGVAHDDVHREIADEQERDWKEFLESVDRRRKARGGA